MIFVTVGTHEQPFDRLIEYMDNWAAAHNESVVIQTGYSLYKPQHCGWSKLYPHQKMLQWVSEARIVITHGGPSSFITPLQVGKIPIVVPRLRQYGEHVNDHQLEFCRQVANRQGGIIVVEDIDELGRTIDQYDSMALQISNDVHSNNSRFCCRFAEIVAGLVG